MRSTMMRATLAFASAGVLGASSLTHAQPGRQVVAHVLEEPGWVGITPDSINPLVVGLVAAGTPAAWAGLLPGDRIVSIDGADATTRRLYQRQFPIGELVQLTLVRGSRRLGTFSLTAVENPYAVHLAAQAREDSLMREVQAYRLELARRAAAADTSLRVDAVRGYTFARLRAEDPPEAAGLLDGKVAGVVVRAAPAPPGARPTAAAQTGSIAGVVTDGYGTTLQGVTVQVANAGKGSVTDHDGKYVITNVPQGTHSVHARRVGYSAETVDSVDVVTGEETRVDIAMSTTVLRLRSVVVTGAEDPTYPVRPYSEARSYEAAVPRLGARGNLVAGATLELLNPALGTYFGGVSEGVFVLRVAPESPAAAAGLQPGDVIESVNGRRVIRLEDLTTGIEQARGAITLAVQRRGQRVTVPLRR